MGSIFSIAFAQQQEYCSNGIATDPDADCEDDGFKTFGNARNMIVAINCPQGVNSPNPNCAGYALKNGKTQAYEQAVVQAIRNYGCNCFPNNKRVEHPINGNPVSHPGANGEPVGDLDAHCKIGEMVEATGWGKDSDSACGI